MQYNIYFRKGNWDRFEQEENKSKLINELLDKHYGQYPVPDTEYPKVQAKLESPQISQEPFVPRPPDPNIGYPCCLKAKPCKHWEYDGMSGQWVNSLTGKTREVV
jgi:hypothetical protein